MQDDAPPIGSGDRQAHRVAAYARAEPWFRLSREEEKARIGSRASAAFSAVRGVSAKAQLE
jgi:hypothetical protein